MPLQEDIPQQQLPDDLPSEQVQGSEKTNEPDEERSDQLQKPTEEEEETQKEDNKPAQLESKITAPEQKPLAKPTSGIVESKLKPPSKLAPPKVVASKPTTVPTTALNILSI